jgi:DNA-binding response OmpR family regulator
MALAVVIDGDTGLSQKLTRLLEGEGFSVLEAVDGAEALQLTFDAKPAIAVVGVEVSLGGSNLIRILRAACPIPIIALVGGDDTERVVEALDSGADDAIPRTCD